MRRTAKTITWILVLVLACVLLAGCGAGKDKDSSAGGGTEKQEETGDKAGTDSSKAPSGDEKTVTVIVTHADETTKEFTYTTRYEMLGDLLRDEGLVDGFKGTAGYYVTTVDGEKADDHKQEWWMVSQNGEMTQKGVDLTPLVDGDKYELTFTNGFY